MVCVVNHIHVLYDIVPTLISELASIPRGL